MATEGEWHLVTRRKPNPTTGSNSASAPATQAFKPFHTQPTFADMVRRPSSPPPTTAKTSLRTNPSTLTTINNPAFYISPHCPSQLRFPPSPRYVEWKGRCFQCCRMGHNAAHCRNPKRCGKCWGQGHIGSRCTKVPNQIDNRSGQGKLHDRKMEPSFADLFDSPIVSKPMPEDRPQKSLVFVERDEQYFQEIKKLEGAVIMYNPHLEGALTIEQVANYAVRSNLVTTEEISVGVMTKSRYVIMLPNGLAPEVFIKAIPLDVWNEGFSFYQWSPLDDATLVMPHFKVLIDLVGIPLDLFREKEVIRATSSMGIFLGTVSRPLEGDVAIWTVVVATTNLSLIPHQIGYMIGGLETAVDVIPKTWKHCPLYTAGEMAQPKEKYKPTSLETPSPASKQSIIQEEEELFQISRTVLMNLCKGKDPTELPEAVRAAVLGPAMREAQGSQLEGATANQREIIAHNTTLEATENQNSAVNEPINPTLPLSLQVVCDTYEVGQDMQNHDSSGEVEKRVPQEVNKGADSIPFISQEAILVCDKVIKETSIFQPRILQRGEAVIELGDSSKSRRCNTKTVTVFSPKKLRPSTLQKRKMQEKKKGKRAKPKKRPQKQARLVTNSDGLFEVQVNYDFSSSLSSKLGFETQQVQQALQVDNEERASTVIEKGMNNEGVLSAPGEEESQQVACDNLMATGSIQDNLMAEVEVASGIYQGFGVRQVVTGLNQETPVPGLNQESLMEEVACQTRIDQGEHLTDFDPDSEDELSSDFD